MKNEIVLSPSYWASVSGGKDSLYMLKLILTHPQQYKLDGVIHYELETDFPFINDVVNYMQQECERRNIKFVRIKPRKTWEELYNKYGYPNRIKRWCNGCYKLDSQRQLKEFLKTQNMYLISYVGICKDEVKRIRDDNKIIYPLVDYGINEDDILEWAKEQPIFNDYYKYNRRCGCMCCPLASLDNLAYTKKYYPKEYERLMNLALETEKQFYKKKGKRMSSWSSNPKYDTKYRMQKVDEIIKGVYNLKDEKRKESLFMNEIAISTKFETSNKKLNTALNGIVKELEKGRKAGEAVAKHLTDIYVGELWQDTEYTSFGDITAVFGIGKQHGYKLVKAYNLKYNEETLSERLSAFTLSQITEMERLAPSEIMMFLDDSTITADMTLKAIRDVVTDYKKSEEASNADDTQEEAEDTSEELEVGDALPEDDGTIQITYRGMEFKVGDTKHVDKFVSLLKKLGYLEDAEA